MKLTKCGRLGKTTDGKVLKGKAMEEFDWFNYHISLMNNLFGFYKIMNNLN